MPVHFITLIVISVLIWCRATGQNIDENTIRMPSDIGLKGKVKTLKKRSYYAVMDSGKIVKGNVYRGTHVREDYTLEFDDQGLVTAWTGMDPDKTQEVYSSRKYIYDSLGRIIRLYYGSTTSCIYTYDSLTQKLKSVSNMGSSRRLDTPESKEFFFYNQKGQLIKKTDTDYHSKTETYTVTYWYIYDSKGRIIKESKSFTNSQAVGATTTYTYTKRQTLIAEKTAEPKVPEFYQTLDSTGRLIEYRTKFNWEKTYSTITTYTYNLNNDVGMETNYLHGKLDDTLGYQYEYDEKGNWTKMIVFLNDQPHCIHLREITYY